MQSQTAFDEADLNAFVDGRLEPARAAALAESLASDPDARSRVDAWKRQNDSLRTMFASVLFEQIPVRLVPTSLPSEPAVPAKLAPPRRGGTTSPGRLARGVLATTFVGTALTGFAAGALASLGTHDFGLSPAPAHVAGGPAYRITGDATPAERTLAARAAEAHRTFSADLLHPVEITAAEAPRLLHWIQRRLGTSLSIPDLQRSGWSLLGGRIVPGRLGPAAFLVYADGTERLGVYIARGADAGADTVVTSEGDATRTSVATWGDEAFSYALTSSRTPDWLDRNAEALRGGIASQIPAGTAAR